MKENKLIAEFMGLCPLSRSGFISDKKQEYYGSLSDLQYHTSWDWLMPVVEKIEEDGYGFERNKQEDGDWQCLITKGYDIVYQKFADCSIDATYDAVVEFIKQLNKES